MNDTMTKDGKCTSHFDVREAHGGFALCRRELGHEGMHVGPAPDSDVFQWADEHAWQHVEVKTKGELDDELWWLPPLGATIKFTHVDCGTSSGILRANVLGEAIPIVGFLIDNSDTSVRTLVAWADVSSVSWEIES